MADLLAVDAPVSVQTEEWDVEGNFLGEIVTPPDGGGGGEPTKATDWWFFPLVAEGPRFEVTSTWTQKRLFGYFPGEPQGINVFKKTDGTYTNEQPDPMEDIDIWYLGGHVHFISEEEAQRLIDAGYGADVHAPSGVEEPFTLRTDAVSLRTDQWTLRGVFIG